MPGSGNRKATSKTQTQQPTKAFLENHFFEDYTNRIIKITRKHTYEELAIRCRWILKSIFDDVVMPHPDENPIISQRIAVFSINEIQDKMEKFSSYHELDESEIQLIYSASLKNAKFYIHSIEKAFSIICDNCNVDNLYRDDLRENIKKYIDDARAYGKDVGQSEDVVRNVTNMFIQILRDNKKILGNDMVFDRKMADAFVRQAFFMAEEAWTFKQRDSLRLIHDYISAAIRLIHDPKHSFVFLRSAETESVLEAYLLAGQEVFKSLGFLIDEEFITYFSGQLNKRMALLEKSEGYILGLDQLHTLIAPILLVSLKICNDYEVTAKDISCHLTGHAKKMFDASIINNLERHHLKLVAYKPYLDSDSSGHSLFQPNDKKEMLDIAIPPAPKEGPSSCAIL